MQVLVTGLLLNTVEGVEEYLDPLSGSYTEILDVVKLFEGNGLGHRKAF